MKPRTQGFASVLLMIVLFVLAVILMASCDAFLATSLPTWGPLPALIGGMR